VVDKTDNVQRFHELQLLEMLQEAPEARQADLAVRVGVSVGTVNWHLKRLAAKGLIKVKQIGRWRWQYLLTAQGIAEKAQLTAAYVQYSMTLYRRTRARALTLLNQVRAAGYEHVRLCGEGELLEVCRLTGLEQGIKIVPDQLEAAPLISQVGLDLELTWPPDFDLEVRRSQRLEGRALAGGVSEGLDTGDERRL